MTDQLHFHPGSISSKALFSCTFTYHRGTSLKVKDAPLSETYQVHKIKLIVTDEWTSLPVTSNEFLLIITQNHPPTLSGSLPNLTIYKGQGSISVSIPSGLFSDAENSFTISASSSSSIINSIFNNSTDIVFQWYSDKIGTLSITVLWSKLSLIKAYSWSRRTNC